MKEAWDKTTNTLEEFQTMLQDFIKTAPIPASEIKRLHELNKKWREVTKAVNTFDSYVSPVSQIAVTLPEAGQRFIEVWNMWKEYLTEQHGVVMRSRSEVMSLKRLFEMADNNPDEAIFYLEHAMSIRWRNFYKVDKNKASEPNNERHESDF